MKLDWTEGRGHLVSKVQSMKKKNVEREVWNRVQRISIYRVLKEREKVTKVSYSYIILIHNINNHKFPIEPHRVGGGLLEKNGLVTSWSKIITHGKK